MPLSDLWKKSRVRVCMRAARVWRNFNLKTVASLAMGPRGRCLLDSAVLSTVLSNAKALLHQLYQFPVQQRVT